jgi:hypothetical protein
VQASLAASDLQLTNLTTGQVVSPSSMDLDYDSSSNTATFTFPGYPGAVLPDGNYRAVIEAEDVTDASGNPLPSDHLYEFFHLTGDANRDRRVNLQDFNILASNFGRSDRDFTQGDFNYDDVVNLVDFNYFASKFGTEL